MTKFYTRFLVVALISIVILQLLQHNTTAFSPAETIPRLGHCYDKRMRSFVRYLKTKKEIQDRNSCAPSMDVLRWITTNVWDKSRTFIIAYGELIHLLREKSFFYPNGSYIDDDIDVWTSFEMFEEIYNLEPELWRRFGWTIRVFHHCEQNYTVFGQLVASCGHNFSTSIGKATQDHPTIELYPLLSQSNNVNVIDVWQGIVLPKSLIYPTSQRKLNPSKGYNKFLDLQIPQHADAILTCLYGDWMVPSDLHAGEGDEKLQCFQQIARNIIQSTTIYTGGKYTEAS